MTRPAEIHTVTLPGVELSLVTIPADPETGDEGETYFLSRPEAGGRSRFSNPNPVFIALFNELLETRRSRS